MKNIENLAESSRTYNNVKTFEEILKLAEEKGVIIQNGRFLNRSETKGIGIELPDGSLGVLVNVVNIVKDYIEKSICIESLSQNSKKIISRYYEFDNEKFKLQSESEYPLNPIGNNINLRKMVWGLNKDGTISEKWRYAKI